LAAHANNDRVPPDRKGLPFKEDNSPSTSTACGAIKISPTPTAAPHDEVVHPHAGASAQGGGGQALGAEAAQAAGGGGQGGAARRDQSGRAAHQ
jgi:hypothetical protein